MSRSPAFSSLSPQKSYTCAYVCSVRVCACARRACDMCVFRLRSLFAAAPACSRARTHHYSHVRKRSHTHTRSPAHTSPLTLGAESACEPPPARLDLHYARPAGDRARSLAHTHTYTIAQGRRSRVRKRVVFARSRRSIVNIYVHFEPIVYRDACVCARAQTHTVARRDRHDRSAAAAAARSIVRGPR